MSKKKFFKKYQAPQNNPWEDDLHSNWPLLSTAAMFIIIIWWFIMHCLLMVWILTYFN